MALCEITHAGACINALTRALLHLTERNRAYSWSWATAASDSWTNCSFESDVFNESLQPVYKQNIRIGIGSNGIGIGSVSFWTRLTHNDKQELMRELILWAFIVKQKIKVEKRTVSYFNSIICKRILEIQYHSKDWDKYGFFFPQVNQEINLVKLYLDGLF